jgi:hypothetical protein
MNADNTLFSCRADVLISKQVYCFSLLCFASRLVRKHEIKQMCFQNTLTSTLTTPLVFARRRTDVSPPLWCSLYRGCSRSLQHARCFVQFAMLFVLQLSHVPSHVLLWPGSAATLRTFCTLSGGSKDNLLTSCYNQPTTSHSTILLPNYSHVFVHGALNGARK